MPAGTPVDLSKIERFCRNCGAKIEIKIFRDIDRKFFCSRHCSSKYYFEHGHKERLMVTHTAESIQKQRETLKRLFSDPTKHPAWKGGKHYSRRLGYVLIRVDKKWIPEHRLVAEKALGRKLKRNELVHHIDGDTSNNKNSNLLICDSKYHSQLHAKMSYLYQQLVFGEEHAS